VTVRTEVEVLTVVATMAAAPTVAYVAGHAVTPEMNSVEYVPVKIPVLLVRVTLSAGWPAVGLSVAKFTAVTVEARLSAVWARPVVALA
jgi:hypothetical protein